jgi:C-terminal processing protease CtpA/Prc
VRNTGALLEYLGAFVPPIALAQVEGRSVVAYLPEPAAAASAGIGIGDEILSVDGEPVSERRSRLEPLFAASTPQALHRDIERRLLRGAKGSVAKLRIRDAAGTEREVQIERTAEWTKIGWLPAYRQRPGTYGLLPSGVAYIDLERLTRGEVDAAMNSAEPAPAIIFDLRGYPKSTGFKIAPRLVKTKPGKPVIGAVFSPPFLTGESLGDAVNLPGAKLTFAQSFMATDKPSYQGRVAVLINEWTQSQAEHTCLWFAAAANVTFIGSATAGANGDVTNLVLPGGLTASFTGVEVRFPDGGQLQRLGVQPHIAVKPSLAGVRAQRDEVLDAAVDFLTQQEKH